MNNNDPDFPTCANPRKHTDWCCLVVYNTVMIFRVLLFVKNDRFRQQPCYAFIVFSKLVTVKWTMIHADLTGRCVVTPPQTDTPITWGNVSPSRRVMILYSEDNVYHSSDQLLSQDYLTCLVSILQQGTTGVTSWDVYSLWKELQLDSDLGWLLWETKISLLWHSYVDSMRTWKWA